MNNEKEGRYLKLEEKAKDEFLSNTDWDIVINTGLDPDEAKEYWALFDEKNAEEDGSLCINCHGISKVEGEDYCEDCLIDTERITR